MPSKRKYESDNTLKRNRSNLVFLCMNQSLISSSTNKIGQWNRRKLMRSDVFFSNADQVDQENWKNSNYMTILLYICICSKSYTPPTS
jgi:hypothetical protein